MSDAQSSTNQWFYEEKGERKGGVSEQDMIELIRAGRLGYGSSVWAHGFTEWSKLENTPLRQHLQHTPPPLVGSQVNNTLVWVLAFAPIIGYLMEWFVAGAINGSEAAAARAMENASYWYITLALNLLLSFFDEKRLQKAGHNTSRFRGWVWLVPVYLYQRAKNLQQNLAYFIVWLVSFALVLLA
ncbi:TPA: DUF4339 domain-containing protein [Pseudomonas aeruginosa]|nr:DUF4339 domain-containing protein [Pseudomonas aeruginosa]